MTFTALRGFIAEHQLKILALIGWGIIIAAAWLYMSVNALSPGELIQQLRELLLETWYGPVLYIAAYLFVRPLILFPASWMSILAGSVYGLGIGFIIGWVVGTFSSFFPYAVGRWFTNSMKDRQEEQAKGLRRFTQLIQRRPFEATITLRLIWLPYDVVSIFLGSLHVPFLQFLAGTALANISGTFAFVGLGAAFEGSLATGDLSNFNPLTLLFSALMWAVSLGLAQVLRRRQEMAKGVEDAEKILM
jgi:uncharacterized membrane protein YdjX (TVP38/TMEM64 family)